MLDNTVTYPGVREGLAALDGMPMAVLTNKPVRFSRQILEGWGLPPTSATSTAAIASKRRNPIQPDMGVLHARFRRRPRPSHARRRFRNRRTDRTQCRHLVLLCYYGLGRARLVDSPPDLMVDRLTELADQLDRQASQPRRR